MRLFDYKNAQLIFLIWVFSFLFGCSSNPAPPNFSGRWQQVGLEKMEVNILKQFEEIIYATTDSGLYRTNKTAGDWASLGLKEKDVLDVAFLPDNKMLTAVRITGSSSGKPSMFLTSNNGQNWQPHMGNYGGKTGKYTLVQLLATPSKQSDTLFAGGMAWARSLNGGKSWQLFGPQRWDLWGGSLELLKADPYHNGHIWIGGHDAVFWPFLSRSTDGGDSWEALYFVQEGVEATVKDVWVSPDNINNFLIATGGILHSTDGGVTWTSVFSQAKVTSLTHSARNPETVYASGRNQSGTLFFAASGDFGDSWETIEWENSPAGVQVNDMVSVMEKGREVLYFGTNKGVYSYRFEE